MSTLLGVFVLLTARFAFGYDITWGTEYTYFDGGTRNPYLINLRSNDDSNPQFLLICYERTDVLGRNYTGMCETIRLVNDNMEFGPQAIFSNSAADPYQIQLFDNGPTSYFLLAYTNADDSSEGPGDVLISQYNQLTGGLIYGTPAVFNDGLNDQSRLLELQNNGYFIVCFSVGPRNQYDTACRIGQYTPGTLATVISAQYFDMTVGHPTDGMGVTRINGNEFLACFSVYIQRIGVCFVGTVEDDFNDGLQSVISYGNEIIFSEDGPIDEIKIIHASQTVLILCYLKNNLGECRFAEIQSLGDRSTVVIQSTIYDFEYDDIVDSPAIFRVAPNTLPPNNDNPELLGVCYVDDQSGVCRFGEIDLDNLSIKFDENQTNSFSPTNGVGKVVVRYIGQNTDEDANRLVVCYTAFSGSTPLFNQGKCKYGIITVPAVNIE